MWIDLEYPVETRRGDIYPAVLGRLSIESANRALIIEKLVLMLAEDSYAAHAPRPAPPAL